MKRIGNLFEKTFTIEALHLAFQTASKLKHSKRACFNFERSLGMNLKNLHREIHSNRYKPMPYYSFLVYEPKQRRIFAPAFRDLVVQHAIYRTIYPVFNNTFIDQSFACRVGMGTHKAADYAQAAIKACDREHYTLKLDIRKFFYRIDRAILRTLMERKIKDERFVDLMCQFTDYGDSVGIPIGNLLSQIYALIYLNPLDHYIKRELKIKSYCRYVDDFILFDITATQCVQYQKQIEQFITEELHLEFSRTTAAKVQRGINFVGYRTWASKRFIRKHSLYNFHRAVKRSKLDSVISILGHARKTHSLSPLLKHVKEHNHALYLQLPKTYRRNSYSRIKSTG